MDIKDLLSVTKKILDEAEIEKGNYRVIKSLPASKEEIALWEKMEKDSTKAFDILRECVPNREKFWAMVQVRLDAFGQELSYNKKTKEIEFKEKIK